MHDVDRKIKILVLSERRQGVRLWKQSDPKADLYSNEAAEQDGLERCKE
jgi:hypothetical protein